MADFVDYVERSLALQAWLKSDEGKETLRRIRPKLLEMNPLFKRLVEEGKIKTDG